MNIRFATREAFSYQVATPVFQGPLDLLLHLIERAELDITNLSLALVTDQYLEHLRNLEEQAAEEVSAFLVIAAKLLQIKSEALLPQPTLHEPEEDDLGEDLVFQLKAYKRFKEIANQLGERESANLHSYLRLVNRPNVKSHVDLGDFDLSTLVSAARERIKAADGRPEIDSVVTAHRITIRDKIGHIVESLRGRGRITFKGLLLDTQSRLDVVMTFLAVLELVKRYLIHARQETLFGEIEIESQDTWDDDLEFESEFGE